jgi:hypothetical protein
MIVIGAQTGFYEAAVRVIPVLLLVLVVGEGRVIKTDRERMSEWRSATIAALFTTGVLLLGELAADHRCCAGRLGWGSDAIAWARHDPGLSRLRVGDELRFERALAGLPIVDKA